ncbi:MAG: type II secretion system protein [Prosthecobacter sp.]|nr:type II secretion system protein [Prosthecobacter sp.]
MIRSINHARLQSHHCRPERWRGAFSLTEMVLTISIIAILAGVVLVSMGDSFTASKETLAMSRVEMLNRALYQFAQQNYEMVFTARNDSGADEMFVLRTMQYRNPDEDKAKLGAPYLTPTYNPTTSSSVEDYRLRWTGKLYELLRPGQAGSGIKMNFDASDLTQAFQFPTNFQMAGR